MMRPQPAATMRVAASFASSIGARTFRLKSVSYDVSDEPGPQSISLTCGGAVIGLGVQPTERCQSRDSHTVDGTDRDSIRAAARRMCDRFCFDVGASG
jgi:hypothetical protein